MRSIRAQGFVKHPIIVDKESMVVLDGVHRVFALKKLGVKRVPACLVYYKNPNIKVGGWYRTISDASNVQNVLEQVEQISGVTVKTGKFDKSAIGVTPTAAAIKFRNKTFLVNASFKNLKEAFNIIEQIEEGLKSSGFVVKYETERDALKSLREGRVNVVLCTPRLCKQDIIEAAVAGEVFASKATRHVIPARLMGVNVPLSLLRREKRPLSEVNDELNRMLQRRRLKRIPSGSLLDGRRYEEGLYIFEE